MTDAQGRFNMDRRTGIGRPNFSRSPPDKIAVHLNISLFTVSSTFLNQFPVYFHDFR